MYGCVCVCVYLKYIFDLFDGSLIVLFVKLYYKPFWQKT